MLRRRVAPVLRRFLSTSPHNVLGVPIGASKQHIKLAYYELAKATHPDAQPVASEQQQSDGSSHEAFLKIQQAFEELMAANGPGQAVSGVSTTSKSAAARGNDSRSSRAAGAPRRGQRPMTLAEILCRRLDDEPGVDGALRIWADILEQRLQVTDRVASALFRECASELPPSGAKGLFDDAGGPSAADGAAVKPGMQTALEVWPSDNSLSHVIVPHTLAAVMHSFFSCAVRVYSGRFFVRVRARA